MKNYIILLACVMILAIKTDNYNKLERNISVREYRGLRGKTDELYTYKMLGMKKVLTSLLWVDNTLNIGDSLAGDRSKKIYQTSKKISYMNPYYVNNYYSTVSVLALINTYKKYVEATEILNYGLGYNSDSKELLKLRRGIVAVTKGDSASLLKELEDIVKTRKEASILSTLAFVYERRYEKTKSNKDFIKMIKYSLELLKTEEKTYRVRTLDRLNKYGIDH